MAELYSFVYDPFNRGERLQAWEIKELCNPIVNKAWGGERQVTEGCRRGSVLLDKQTVRGVHGDPWRESRVSVLWAVLNILIALLQALVIWICKSRNHLWRLQQNCSYWCMVLHSAQGWGWRFWVLEREVTQLIYGSRCDKSCCNQVRPVSYKLVFHLQTGKGTLKKNLGLGRSRFLHIQSLSGNQSYRMQEMNVAETIGCSTMYISSVETWHGWMALLYHRQRATSWIYTARKVM